MGNISHLHDDGGQRHDDDAAVVTVALELQQASEGGRERLRGAGQHQHLVLVLRVARVAVGGVRLSLQDQGGDLAGAVE